MSQTRPSTRFGRIRPPDEAWLAKAPPEPILEPELEKVGIGYAPLWNAFKRIAAHASADEKLALFSGTARRAYRLD